MCNRFKICSQLENLFHISKTPFIRETRLEDASRRVFRLRTRTIEGMQSKHECPIKDSQIQCTVLN